MTNKEIDLLIRRVNIAMETIKTANMRVNSRARWDKTKVFYAEGDISRSDLNRTMLSLQKDLFTLRKAMYQRGML